MLPGQAGSTNPPRPDWMARRIRELEQTVEQLRGQLARTATVVTVVDVTVAGSTLTVTFSDGSTTTSALP